jgi:hypothetical protein
MRMPSREDRPPPYRDGLGAVLAAHEARLARVRLSARALDAHARAELPKATAERLSSLEAQLSALPADAAALDAAEAALDAYEPLVEESLWLAGELQQLHAPDRSRARRLRLAPLALAALVGLGMLAASGLEQLQRERASRDCRRSDACRRLGRCEAEREGDGSGGFRCLATSDRDCAASAQCAVEGQCTRRGDTCAVGGDTDCRASRACAEQGQCRAQDVSTGRFAGERRCVVTHDGCRTSQACAHAGRCTAGEDTCVAVLEDDCARSERCAAEGACALGSAGCVPCRASNLCSELGRCTADGARCVVTADEDCQHSRACCRECRCTAGAGACVIGKNQAPRWSGSKACRSCP